MFAPLQDDIILVGDNGGAICWKGESLYLSEMDAADWHTLAGQARSAGHAAVLCGLETAYVDTGRCPHASSNLHSWPWTVRPVLADNTGRTGGL